MTLLITDSLGSAVLKETDGAWKLREASLKVPLTTIYKVRTGTVYRLFMKTGRNNFLELQDKEMYRIREIASGTGMVLALARDKNCIVPVHHFAIQIAFLKLR